MCEVNLKVCIHSYSVGIEAYVLAWAYILFPTLCVQATKALARLSLCTGLSEPIQLTYAIRNLLKYSYLYFSEVSDA